MPAIRLDEMADFLKSYFAEHRRPEQFPNRWAGVESADSTGQMPDLTGGELRYAARVAWRNSNRCIGRLFWKSLVVRDARSAGTESDIFDSLIEHLRLAFNGGAIRSVITVFAPARDNGNQIRIWNHQLIRYAGYRQNDKILGDPAGVELTDQAIRLGWDKPNRTRFDVLPLIIQVPGRAPRLFEVPQEFIHEVPLSHPQFDWFEKLGLKWYAMPVLSDLCLDAGGQRFTAAPFNGWYMGTEIGARNLADESRYNLLPVVAEKLGLDTRTPRSLWKDRALIELNQAVLHSYAKHGVKLVDHHTAGAEFMAFAARERAAGREPTGDWSWLVPPVSGATSPVFHCPWVDRAAKPNFFSQARAWE